MTEAWLTPDLIHREHDLGKDLRQADIDALIAKGVPSMALVRQADGQSSLLLRDRVVFDGDRFEFSRYAHGGDTVTALTLLALDEFGEAIDIVAWRPSALASWLGRAAMLGQEQVLGPRLNEPLLAHRSVVDWLRAEREGIYVLDDRQAARLLQNETLWVDDSDHARRLRKRLTIAPPPIAVKPRHETSNVRIEHRGGTAGRGMMDRIAILTPRKRSAPAKTNDLVTEDQAALRFADLYGDQLRFCHSHGAWFAWNGSVWRRNNVGVAFDWARQLARQLAAEEPDKVRFITSKTSFAAGVERFSRSAEPFRVESDYWDADPFLLGTPSGTVDLRTGRLIPANPDDGITKSTAVAPSTRADCPKWLRFLTESTGDDPALIRFLQQWAGYSLTGDTREHALAFLFGPGGNGKSVFVNVLSSIANDYHIASPMETFVASGGDKHPTDLAMLRGARMVTASETEEGRAWAESRIKQLTGGDKISARFMRQDFFTFLPTFKLMIVGNHMPVLRNVDDAARRRFNLVPFTLKPARPDPQLEQSLKAEWPGILRWMIEGCLDWQKNGLARPASVTSATRDYFDAQDVLAQWLSDECDVEPGNTWKSESSAALFEAWSRYAIAAGEKPGTRKSFADIMQKRGLESHRIHGGVRSFRGVRLKPRSDPRSGWDQ